MYLPRVSKYNKSSAIRRGAWEKFSAQASRQTVNPYEYIRLKRSLCLESTVTGSAMGMEVGAGAGTERSGSGQ